MIISFSMNSLLVTVRNNPNTQGGGRPTPGAGRLRADVAHAERESGAAALTTGPRDPIAAALGGNSPQPRSETDRSAVQSFSLDRHANLQESDVPYKKCEAAETQAPLCSVGRFGATPSGWCEGRSGDLESYRCESGVAHGCMPEPNSTRGDEKFVT